MENINWAHLVAFSSFFHIFLVHLQAACLALWRQPRAVAFFDVWI